MEEDEESVPVRTRIEIFEGCLLDVKIKGFITVLLTTDQKRDSKRD